MASYTEDAMRAKLSSLNETQESIVTVAQWMLFHKRHADSAAKLWFERLQITPPAKRLNFVYIANEVVQQSKARKRTEYLNAFSPIISEAITVAYKGAPNDVKQKLRRVVEVWRDRQVFEAAIQNRVEASLDELDKTGSGKKGTLGGSLFSSGGGDPAPKEVQPLVPLQNEVTKSEITAHPVVTTANAEFERVTGPTATFSNNNVHAAQLAQVLKSLSHAEGAVAASIKARRLLIDGLEKLLKANQDAVTNEEARRSDILQKRTEAERQKSDVELVIMRGLNSDGEELSTLDAPEPPRPDVEGLTPPPMDSLTPPGDPQLPTYVSTTGADMIEEQPANQDELPPQDPRLLAMGDNAAAIPGINANGTHQEPRGPSPKKRKISGVGNDEVAVFMGEGGAMDGIDPDVAEMLGGDT